MPQPYVVARECEMKTVSSVMMLLLLLISHIAASPRLSDEEQCQLDVSQLRLSIASFEERLLIGEWQLKNLQEHNSFYRTHASSSNSSTEATGDLPALKVKPSVQPVVYDFDCAALYDRARPPSGFYRIKPRLAAEAFLAYCDMSDGGGWTVIQQRRNGKVDFNRDWEEYKTGFGHFKARNDEFWLGNEHIYTLVKEGGCLLKIDLMDWSGERTHAMYENFRISNEKDKYRLQFGLYSGRAGDALSGGSHMEDQWSISHHSMQFSTRDRDHDRYLQGSCAKENRGGWWYNRCHAANLNGRFYRGGIYKAKNDNGVVWQTWRGLWYSLRHTTLKLRPMLFMDSLGSGAGADG